MVPQPEAKQQDPKRSKRKVEGSRTKVKNPLKRRVDNAEGTKESGSHKAVKKRKSDNDSDQKKRKEIEKLEELLEKKKKELDLVNECQVVKEASLSSGEKFESKIKKGKVDSKLDRGHKVSKKEQLSRSQVQLSWTDDENSEGGEGSNIKSSISFSQNKGQTSAKWRKGRQNVNEPKGTSQPSRKDKLRQEEEKKRPTKISQIKNRRKLPKPLESTQSSNLESQTKTTSGQKELGSDSLSSKSNFPSTSTDPLVTGLPLSRTRPRRSLLATNHNLPTVASKSESSLTPSNDHSAASIPSLLSSRPAPSTTSTRHFPISTSPVTTRTRNNSQENQKTPPAAPFPCTSQYSASVKPDPSLAKEKDCWDPTTQSVEEKKKLEEELDEAMEWEEVGVEQAVEASHRVRELLKEEQMEGVEEDGEQEEQLVEGQQGKLVMVVDTNVLLSNGFPLVQELLQRCLCTIFLPWQVKPYKISLDFKNILTSQRQYFNVLDQRETVSSQVLQELDRHKSGLETAVQV